MGHCGFDAHGNAVHAGHGALDQEFLTSTGVFKMKISDKWLCLHCDEYKLRRISKAVGIELCREQRDFALGKTDYLANGGRSRDEMYAIIFRLLLLNPDEDDIFMRFIRGLGIHSDLVYGMAKRHIWYRCEYRMLSTICYVAGIPVPYWRANNGK